jgi:hypothetical protein
MQWQRKRPRDKEHYVKNKDFLIAMIKYKEDCNLADENKVKRPRIPNYIGDCFIKIATRISFKPNYVNYPFKDEMISDAYFTCVKYIQNFDHTKSDVPNPFAYFTSIVENCFKQRIAKEKKQLIIKERLLESKGFSEVFSEDNPAEGGNSSDYNTIKDNIYLKLKYN